MDFAGLREYDTRELTSFELSVAFGFLMQHNGIYMAVSRYHKDDGNFAVIPENKQIWYGSDGKILKVEYENSMEEAPMLTPEIEEKADSFKLGIYNCYISNFFSEVAGIPMGGVYIDSIENPSPAADAGLKEGDIIVKIGDIWIFDENSLTLAKGLMNETETSTLLYYRKGERRETEIATF